ncbi:membrane protein [Parapedobacter pyrenivorans]|uniref:Membrane protein n=1 Tax=Parapedobacter pyrenivorans TaxID=1305674 RepID=A0A917HLV4_9SPHI|nr:outer membrane lipoprotein carrier protein LolA [Parapedobacter pyrenivorans]GGG82605.1 membrane protein [Parapedobacter pyrenivorans]
MIKSIYIVQLLLPILLGFSLQGRAQTDPAAKSLLDKVSETYEGYKTVQADFTITIQQPQQTDHTESGTIYMATSAGKYHITMNSQDLISDGKTQWMVLKEEGEVQVTEADQSSDAISPVNIFSFYNKGYKYVAAPNERVGNNQLQVVELTPENTRAPYFKIKLRVNERTLLINDVTIFDKGGNKYVYAIKNTKTNPQIAGDKFVFKQANYPGMEIVDLR